LGMNLYCTIPWLYKWKTISMHFKTGKNLSDLLWLWTS